jgi:hypothetical protein
MPKQDEHGSLRGLDRQIVILYAYGESCCIVVCVVQVRGLWLRTGVREAMYTRLEYKTRLSRLHTMDFHLALAFLRSGHSATIDPE